jgi:hypothetical protein
MWYVYVNNGCAIHDREDMNAVTRVEVVSFSLNLRYRQEILTIPVIDWFLCKKR